MNQTIKHTLAALVVSAALSTVNAETAYTNPVMAASNQIAGNGGSGTALTTLGITALNPVDATGSITSIASVADGNTTLNVADTPDTWATNDFANQGGFAQFNFRDVPLYYIEISDVTDSVAGPLDGQILDVVATATGTPNTLTVGADLTGMGGDLAGTTFEVRKVHTIASIFGAANEAGLLSGQNAAASSIIYNLYEGSFEVVYYQTDASGGFFGGNGWRKRGDINTDASDIRVDPDFGLLVGNRSDTPIDLVSVGDVKLGTAKSSIEPGFNALMYKFPVDTTLADSNLYTDGTTSGLAGGQNSATADIIYLFDTNLAQWVIYYYQIDASGGFFGGNGWRKRGDINADQGAVVLTSGTAFVVLRRAATQSVWLDAQPFTIN